MSGRARVTTAHGTFERYVRAPKGEPENFLTREELKAKFDGLAAPYMGANRRDALAEALLAIDEADDVAEIPAHDPSGGAGRTRRRRAPPATTEEESSMSVVRKAGGGAPVPRVVRPVLRGLRGRRRLRASPGTHHQRERQHLVHPAHDEPAPRCISTGSTRRRASSGAPLVNSCLTLSMVAGMSVSDLSQKTIANLGWDRIKLSAPVFVGDTIYAESEIPRQARIEVAPHPGHRDGAHRRQEGGWCGVHFL